jgi:uncharacterized protein YfaP (DUF2135 family)
MIKMNLTQRIRLSMDLPPPPPPPKLHKSRKLIIAIAVILILIILIPSVLVLSGAFKFTPTPGPSTTPTPGTSAGPVTTPNTNPTTTNTHNSINIVTGAKTQVTSQSVGVTGGTVQVTDSASPLNGLKIAVPSTAAEEPIQFQVSYSTVNDISGLPDSCAVVSPMISIETSGSNSFNTYKMFDKPVTVTLPYDSTEANDDSNPVRFYWYDSQTNQLDSAGFLSENKAGHTITFLTGSFSDFVAVRTMLNISGSAWGIDVPVDTGFRPARDGWFIPNVGSYLDLTQGGCCLGMVSYAKWYYSNIATGLHSKYIQGDATEWRDDAVALQLAARAHLATSGIWSSMNSEEEDWALGNAREVALSWTAGMIVTGEPQIIGLKAQFPNGTFREGGHAVLTYEYKNGNFEIYDPNYPGTVPGDTRREIPFTYNSGFTDVFTSALNTNSSGARFNIFYHAGSKLSSTLADYQRLYQSAEQGFAGNNLFPTVTLTDTTTSPAGSTPTDTDSDGIRDTTEAKTTISGTITGGQDQINSTLIFVDNQKYTAAVVDGVFSKEVPIMQGDNNVIILATSVNTFDNWAGFLKDTIKSTASTATMTVTLTWDQDTSDIDLHVLEPGTDGRHIYYQNKGGTLSNPYLDLDNTHGFGPEHYYATSAMTLPGSTNLYGTYQVRVEYYADHSGAETPQTMTWHLNVKYLAFKNTQTGEEFWIQESRSGVLSTPSSSDTGNFNNGGSAWSSIWTIDYSAPNLADYNIPPPPQNVFPT